MNAQIGAKDLGYAVDYWNPDWADEGTIVAQVRNRDKGISNYFTTPSTIFGNGLSAREILEKLQVGADPTHGYWNDVTFYRVPKGGLPMASGKTIANPQFGEGGGDQFWFRKGDLDKLERIGDPMSLDGPYTPREDDGIKTNRSPNDPTPPPNYHTYTDPNAWLGQYNNYSVAPYSEGISNVLSGSGP